MRLPRCVLCSGFAASACFALRATDVPAWAYIVNPPDAPAVVDDGSVVRVPDSEVALKRGELALKAGAPVADWHPEEHAAMPAIVGRGRAPAVYACGYCHLPSGAGRPENASLAGLPADYIREQMLAFQRDERPGSEPGRLPQTVMIAVAKATTAAEIDEAAAYFAALPPVSYLTVIEADEVPRTVVAGWTLRKAPDGGNEALGQRIVEMPEDFERFENRDSRTPYVAYVPVGSRVRGGELVNTGADRTLACIACHGPDLKGAGNIPGLAGRSPGYLIRQLHDFRAGTRRGALSEQMQPVVANLTEADMIAIAAYLAGLTP